MWYHIGMKKNIIAVAFATFSLAGCFTLSQTPYPDAVLTSVEAGRNLSVQLSGFEAAVTSYVPVYSYETVYAPDGHRRHRRHWHTMTVVRQTHIPQVEATAAYVGRAADALEKSGFMLNAANPKYRIDVAFSGPFVSNSEGAAMLVWPLVSLLTADYGTQTWTARMKIYDVATGKVVLYKDYTQKYESYVWGPIPIFSPGGSRNSDYGFMQCWCLSALTDLAMSDATAFLSAQAR